MEIEQLDTEAIEELEISDETEAVAHSQARSTRATQRSSTQLTNASKTDIGVDDLQTNQLSQSEHLSQYEPKRVTFSYQQQQKQPESPQDSAVQNAVYNQYKASLVKQDEDN